MYIYIYILCQTHLVCVPFGPSKPLRCPRRNPFSVVGGRERSHSATCKTDLYDLLTRTAIPWCSEHRTTMECLLIRERLQENCMARWVSSQAMLSDCLTKSLDSQIIRECLKTGRYCLRDEEHVLKERLDRRQRIEWVKGHSSAEKTEEGPQTSSSCMYSTTVVNNPSMHDFWTWGSNLS